MYHMLRVSIMQIYLVKVLFVCFSVTVVSSMLVQVHEKLNKNTSWNIYYFLLLLLEVWSMDQQHRPHLRAC